MESEPRIKLELENENVSDIQHVATSSKVNKKTYRVKSGCFCCRKRKKKCDEKRPSCNGCKRNFLKCVYPLYPNQILPKNFEIESEDVIIIRNNENVTPPAEKEVDAFVDNQLIKMNSSSASPDTPDWSSDVSADLSEFLNNPLTTLQLSNFSQWIPNVEMSDTNSELYFHFIHQFIPSVSPSHAHPKLSPKEVWIPLASESEILREVFLSCGAAQLAYKYPEYRTLSIEKYNKSVKMISDAIMNRNIEGTEDWLFAAIMALCLRDRASGFNGSRCAHHLVAAYKIIRQREKKKLEMFSTIDLSEIDEVDQFESSSGFTVTSTERTLVESFLFNYSVALYTCSYESLIMLPSPFTVYTEMTVWLNSPIYSDVSVKWMNNPILGSSVKEFEILAKLVWLLRFHYCVDQENPHHINENLFWKAITLIKAEIDGAESVITEDLVEVDGFSSVKSLRTSMAITLILFHASKILLHKLVNPSLVSSFPLIQKSVDCILSEAAMIPKDDHSMCLCVFGIFIAGSACIRQEQRLLIESMLVDLSDLLYSSFGLNVLGVLQKSWEREIQEPSYSSFDLVFDREAAEAISF